MKFNTLKIILLVFLFAMGNVYGQKEGTPSGGKTGKLIAPSKTTSVEAQAKELSKQGWKVTAYSLEEQLASTYSLMCKVDTMSGEPAYLWAQQEISSSSLKEAKSYAERLCYEALIRQFTGYLLARCQNVMQQQGATEEQTIHMYNVLTEAVPRIVRMQAKVSLDISKENGKQAAVRTVMLLDKSKATNMIYGECSRKFKEQQDGEVYTQYLQKILSPKPHRSPNQK
ncbi:MAG: hypothetical protein IJU33_04390 [Bacteroidales bacterium]|nr:hypothetical protein [Bacteroidales bacterium]MBR0078120.1 hypothetical protein [Bacteroidales bacterium]